jgi:hypothetical protein
MASVTPTTPPDSDGREAMTERKRSKAEERAYAELNDTLHELDALRREMALNAARLKLDNLPAAWAAVEGSVPVRKRKVRINATYDDDVAKFFRSMGRAIRRG